jgi:hypothetical protein
MNMDGWNFRWLTPFLAVLVFAFAKAQDYPQNYFSSPLEIPLKLSGTFGELRSNHFHSGLDIKTQQRTGLSVLAVANGYVSRIKIERYGYGKALYITHPNGYTSVYAHLERFSDRIEEYVCNRQYEQESYEIQLFPGDLDLRVDQGEVVAYSGNSGGSGGPHLHFEIRDSASRPINPFLFGYDIEDTRAPLVKGLMLYPLSPDARIEGKNEPKKIRLIPIGNNHYRTEFVKASGEIGVAINTSDRQNTGPNQNGIFRLTGELNEKRFFDVKMDKYAFSETRYLNDLIDYKIYKDQKARYTKLFKSSSNPLSLIKESELNGHLLLTEANADYHVDIAIEDYSKNKSTIRLELSCDSLYEPSYHIPSDHEHLVTAAQGYSGTHGNYSVYIPPNAVYRDTFLEIYEENGDLIIHDDVVPLHKNMTVNYNAENLPPVIYEKSYLARKMPWGAAYHVNTRYKAGKLSARTRTLGRYGIERDTIPPTIRPLNFKDGSWVSRLNTLEVEIADSDSGVKDYRATVNGEFLLMEYDYKTDKLVYHFRDGRIKEQENQFKLVVIDEVGNSSTFEAVFYRKQT